MNNMKLMISNNMKKHFNNTDNMIRVNSPWYTKQELINVFETETKPVFLDINIKTRVKPKRSNIGYKTLLGLADKYNVSWVGISNVESCSVYDDVKNFLTNNHTKVCAKIETEKGCWHSDYIVRRFDGIMVDTEDLAFCLGWKRASEEKDRIYKLCENLGVPHFRLFGSVFKYIDGGR